MKKIGFIVILLLLIGISTNAQREERSLDGTWKFKVDEQLVGLTENWQKSMPELEETFNLKNIAGRYQINIISPYGTIVNGYPLDK